MSNSAALQTFPRTLIISPSVFNSYTGTGVMLTNLFRHWPKERLAIAHSDVFPVNEEVCGHFFFLTANEIPWIAPFSLFQKEAAPQSMNASPQSATASAARRLFKKYIATELPRSYCFTPAFTSWIENFRPDLIYTVVNDAHLPFVLAAGKKWNVPVAAHMMDDWPTAASNKGSLGFWFQSRTKRNLARLFRSAKLRLCISEEMAEEYRRRYGFDFQHFHNGVDVERYGPLARTQWGSGDPFQLTYIGSLLPYAQLGSLLDIARVVNEMRSEGLRIELNIFSPWSKMVETKFEKYSGVTLSNALEDADVFPALVKSDVLLIPANFDQYSQKFIRYSLPAKIPMYMLSGSAILAYGPSTVSYIQQAARGEWSVAVQNRNLEELKLAIKRLHADPRLRERIGKKGQEICRAVHDNSHLRADFQESLKNASASVRN